MEQLRTRDENGLEKNWKEHAGVFWSVGKGTETNDTV